MLPSSQEVPRQIIALIMPESLRKECRRPHRGQRLGLTKEARLPVRKKVVFPRKLVSLPLIRSVQRLPLATKPEAIHRVPGEQLLLPVKGQTEGVLQRPRALLVQRQKLTDHLVSQVVQRQKLTGLPVSQVVQHQRQAGLARPSVLLLQPAGLLPPEVQPAREQRIALQSQLRSLPAVVEVLLQLQKQHAKQAAAALRIKEDKFFQIRI